MRLSQHIKVLRSCLLASILGICALPTAFAARDFTPQAGTWIISSENNGQPGRGLAIDVQGNTLFLQVYGYEKSGDSTFYIAAGKMDGNRFTGPLTTYSDGRSFGSAPRDAVLAGSPGDVSIEFKNGLQGTIQFPGEKALEIERFIFTRQDSAYYQGELWKEATRVSQWYALDEQGQFVATWLASLSSGLVAPMKLVLTNLGKEYNRVTLDCERAPNAESIRCTRSALAPTLGIGVNVKAAHFRIVGRQIAGNITLDLEGAEPLKMMGFSRNTTIPYLGGSITGCCINGLESFIPAGFGYERVPTFFPTNGAWIVEDELTGKPGRGLNLDVQGDTMVLQIFNYSSNGRPTFHLGVGKYVGEQTRTSEALATLHQYAGGPSLGGPLANAKVIEDAGSAMVRISSRLPTDPLSIGTLQLPGEAAKTMKRLPLEAPATVQERMLGERYTHMHERLTLRLTRIVGNDVTNDDGSVRCSPIESAIYARCEWLNLPTTHSNRTLLIPLVDDTSGITSITFLRDRYGNLISLGDIPLD